jgi:hypothetical protein
MPAFSIVIYNGDGKLEPLIKKQPDSRFIKQYQGSEAHKNLTHSIC